MPQLAKGGKWVFGWTIVGPQHEIRIPPEAYLEYGFQAGETVLLLRSSRSSGGFIIGRSETLAQAKTNLSQRAFCQAVIGEMGQVVLPSEVDVKPGDQLLVARGSGMGLSFLKYGRIYEEALKHPEIEVFRL
ncbi:MAG: hypothetical protein JXB07_09170 [Anaerolineae bacterium]|nr:hypothetical protein [Anaerolineae bacterium]